MKRRMTMAALLLLGGYGHAADMPDAADHPLIPRVADAQLRGYAHSAYDAGNLIQGVENGKPVAAQPEGARTRLLYLMKPGDSPLMVQKNYQVALEELGEVEEVFSCRDGDCRGQQMASLLWNRDAVPPTHDIKHPLYLLGFSPRLQLTGIPLRAGLSAMASSITWACLRR